MASRLYDASWVTSTLERLAGQIRADPTPGAGKALVGLRTRGAVMADRLGAILRQDEPSLSLGYLDTTMYRDDLHTGSGLRPMQPSEIGFDLNGKDVILVDDVICTGRTIRAAMNALFDYGRPASVRLCVMLDRGGREIPVQPDFRGAHVEVPKGGFVRLKLAESDEREDAVFLVAEGEDEP